MPNTIPKPKATKRLIWNLRTKTKQNLHKTSTRAAYIQNSMQKELSLWSYESSKLKTPSTKILLALSLSLYDWTQQHYTTLYLTTKAHSRGRAAASLSTTKKKTKKKRRRKNKKKTYNSSRGCCFGAVSRAVIARTRCTIPDPKPSTGKTES
jgi:hypothetical protein